MPSDNSLHYQLRDTKVYFEVLRNRFTCIGTIIFTIASGEARLSQSQEPDLAGLDLTR